MNGDNDEKKEPICDESGELSCENVRFLMEYFRGFLETNKTYRLRIPTVTSILNLLIVSFVYQNSALKEPSIYTALLFVFLPAFVMYLGVCGLKAVEASYELFLTAISELHGKLNSDYDWVHNADEIWRYSYRVVYSVGLLSIIFILLRFISIM